ncbi:PREDICTED: uncharacterized protein LOC104801332 [Tarenaya hassleriana]|uniref:uncharacterized protein LOC104801332 n=1 Tax=Tarenaya hassleriana TaxID=28532 RepID=UPI00053C2476|nr:PREDICTED: uncharacterized protein LOC104801332 [Tarenaya hassleriana]
MSFEGQILEIHEDGKTEDLLADGDIFIEIEKLGRNSRRIRSTIGVEGNLDSVWSVLTSYEKLSDFIPTLVASELVERKGNRARIIQIGQQNLALGLKIRAKAVLDCFEKELEILPHGKRRDIEFKLVEGDFHFLQGKWSIEQINKGGTSEPNSKDFRRTTLSYMVDVQPKPWLPVRLIEGRLCNEIKTNLSCIGETVRKAMEGSLLDL